MEIKTLRDKEQELLREVLTKTDWNLEKASRLLQIPLSQSEKKNPGPWPGKTEWICMNAQTQLQPTRGGKKR